MICLISSCKRHTLFSIGRSILVVKRLYRFASRFDIILFIRFVLGLLRCITLIKVYTSSRQYWKSIVRLTKLTWLLFYQYCSLLLLFIWLRYWCYRFISALLRLWCDSLISLIKETNAIYCVSHLGVIIWTMLWFFIWLFLL